MPRTTTRSYGTWEPRPADGNAEELLQARGRKRVNRRIIVCSIFSVLAIVAFMFVAGCLWWAMELTCWAPFNPPYPQPKSWDDFTNNSFAVGFDLTAGYGTASVAFYNGTIIDVARVEGPSEYNSLLARLSLKSSTHPTPPYYGCSAQTGDLRRQWRRYFYKRCGLPASSDVEALASVLGQLKFETDAFLRSASQDSLQVAFVTVPNLPALYLQDLIDAAEYVKIQLVTLPGYMFRSGDALQWPVSEINTAMAGNGIGFPDPSSMVGQSPNKNRNALGINREEIVGIESVPWDDNLFSVLYTNTALTAYVGPFGSAQHFSGVEGIANFSLGLSRCMQSQPLTTNSAFDFDSNTDCPPPAPYWTTVRDALRTALDSYLTRGHELGRVISYGENAHHAQFAALLKEEVLARQSNDDREHQVQFVSENPVFAASRGAAQFAKLCATMSDRKACFPDLRPRTPGW
ncbi:uncharacterized protein Z518_09552 [Rhinocladiella mackenziei CBS 650.93]|uniref:Uncharacterized protein n=1 Tax=Rhinocladiella mackenziei CBS 650.93 TaxID=1442369 RepID=A0A0D2IYW6_9EURO|nr:uncharacterized protein Z518_09552 [Rhinocladiella mackenziei CBS 650.93]KIX01825.1 hypothetical protein Z518_09552 [Rhinocladiella mackenziei CBS 650.93]